VSIICLVCGAYAQVKMPFYSAEVIKNIDNVSLLKQSLNTLLIVFLLKSFLLVISQASGLYYKEAIRLLLVKQISLKALTLEKGKSLTLIKEDSERVTQAIFEGINGFGAAVLFMFTIYATAINEKFLALTMVVVFVFTFFYIRVVKNKVEFLYKNELEKEECYKDSLMSAIANRRKNSLMKVEKIATKSFIIPTQEALSQTIRARLQYSLNIMKFEFSPQIFASVIIALFIIFLITIKKSMLGPEFVMYLGYIFLFTTTSQQVINSSISFVANKHSLSRLSSVVNDT
jgi:ABC-type multidrug transport system fused ATPase/permease subunit